MASNHYIRTLESAQKPINSTWEKRDVTDFYTIAGVFQVSVLTIHVFTLKVYSPDITASTNHGFWTWGTWDEEIKLEFFKKGRFYGQMIPYAMFLLSFHKKKTAYETQVKKKTSLN